ncbi:ADP-glyceromanno-heptose 6-epimerase [Hippea maritima]|uniref:ADP-L-glycero-D-manno-heptose-6-epimerase n=1 Tax=Hippea maritima (strain ATCC 700847 / DSM 10411 / MH2) TaxID=760142 RepID=F2LX32_HIPMA|nr:ADP-glyceromanno-heptose 6-epimerase [Hippea maritima]AEA33090.1 ADP-L-glycero-D-manno-heptose-6-epimerase [Hippea maritima DSM 10411]
MIVVTGGAGFVGSNVVRGLNRAGFKDILIVDNLSNSKKHLNLNTLDFLDFVDKGEFLDNLDKFGKIDVVFHQGACSNTLETDGRYMMKNNYDYSKSLLNYSLNKGIRFIYASSASVYGLGKKGFSEDRTNEYPLNIYAFSKFLFDQYVRRVAFDRDTQVVGLRYFNVYGPNEHHKGKMASVVYHFHNQILDDGTVRLFEGSENFKRDFVFVDDVVDVNLFFYENANLSGIFNVGTGRAESFLEIAQIMQELYSNVRIEFVEFPEELKGKYQDFTKADLNKLRSVGYEKEFTSLEEGVRRYVDVLKSTEGVWVD